MNDVVYCYPESDVLRNKLNIQDSETLFRAEKQLTMLRLLELQNQPLKGKFDLAHLCAIHGYIFQDLYHWAGKLRTVDIAKGNMFCKFEFIQSSSDKLFARLEKDFTENMTDRQQMVKKLAYHFSEINALHPFREGNGRAQREFIRILALDHGYEIDFSYITTAEMIDASKASFLCDYIPMERLFDRAVKNCFESR